MGILNKLKNKINKSETNTTEVEEVKVSTNYEYIETYYKIERHYDFGKYVDIFNVYKNRDTEELISKEIRSESDLELYIKHTNIDEFVKVINSSLGVIPYKNSKYARYEEMQHSKELEEKLEEIKQCIEDNKEYKGVMQL